MQWKPQRKLLTSFWLSIQIQATHTLRLKSTSSMLSKGMQSHGKSSLPFMMCWVRLIDSIDAVHMIWNGVWTPSCSQWKLKCRTPTWGRNLAVSKLKLMHCRRKRSLGVTEKSCELGLESLLSLQVELTSKTRPGSTLQLIDSIFNKSYLPQRCNFSRADGERS